AVQPACQVDQGLGLVLGGVFLGVGAQDRGLGLARGGQAHLVGGLGPVQEPGDHAVLALVDRFGGALPAHGPVHGLDGDLAGEGGGVSLPGGDAALAGLAGGGGGVQRLADRGEDRGGVQVQQRAQARRHARAQVRHVVALVLVQADRGGQGDLHLVGGGDGAHQVRSGGAGVLGDGEQWRDVVAGPGVVGGQEGVVEVEVAYGHHGGPRRPDGADPQVAAAAVDRGARGVGVVQGPGAGGPHGGVEEGGGGDGGVLDRAVDHHIGDVGGHRGGVGGQFCQF